MKALDSVDGNPYIKHKTLGYFHKPLGLKEVSPIVSLVTGIHEVVQY